MNSLLPNKETLLDLPVGTIVARWPITAQIFEQSQIDYCCKGQVKLRAACQQRGIDFDELVSVLHSLDIQSSTDENWLQRSLTDLCQHIETQHHDYLRRELPRLSDLIDKVINAHGQQHPELELVREHFQALRDGLEPHMVKEEEVLFPAIRQMEQSSSVPQFPFGSVTNPIHCMVQEHEHAGEELGRLRELTNDYQPHAGACPTWRVMLDSLSRLEQDMHLHVHAENSILFPRAVELEKAIGT